MRRIILMLIVTFGLIGNAFAVGGHRTTLNWTPVTTYTNAQILGTYGATVCYIVYKSSDGQNFTPVATDISLTTTSWTDSNVVSGQTYFYRITVYDSTFGTESTPSPTVISVIP